MSRELRGGSVIAEAARSCTSVVAVAACPAVASSLSGFIVAGPSSRVGQPCQAADPSSWAAIDPSSWAAIDPSSWAAGPSFGWE